MNGEVVVSPLSKVVLLVLFLTAVSFAVGVRRTEWGLVSFSWTVLGAIISVGYVLHVGLGATTVQYQRLNLGAGIATLFFFIAIIGTLKHQHTGS